jgi:outer membrane biogenesis lipoprotein LolB
MHHFLSFSRLFLLSAVCILLVSTATAQQTAAERISQYEQEKAIKESNLSRYVAEYKAAKGASRETLRVRVELTLHEIFDLNMRIREEELHQLEDQVQEVRKGITYRRNNKAKIVNQRMAELLK